MRVLVIENAEGEGIGLVGEGLRAAGAELETLALWRGAQLPRDEGYALVVALGGPMDAWDDAGHPQLAAEAALLAARARADRATLGICLGAQLLARGLGARVHRAPAAELGLGAIALTAAGRDDRLLAAFDGRLVMHWHYDTFELPAGARQLASSAACEQQAFAWGRRAWGLQFHPECDRAMRDEWAARGRIEAAAYRGPAQLARLPWTVAEARGGAEDDDTALDARGRALGAALAAMAADQALPGGR